MNIVAKISNKLVSNILTTQIAYNASKMQASSTQNTKDSAGKRLGYAIFLIQDWKSSVGSKWCQVMSLQDKEVLSGNQDKMLLLAKTKRSMRKSRVWWLSETVFIEKYRIRSLMLWPRVFQISWWSIRLPTTTTRSFSLKGLN